ncbi:MAG: hypothetical protein GXX98_13575 [Planctomycetes bacterium]|nr:hypothetical protein [Planctomycetota bacterium]
MFTIQSHFMGSFKLGDNINHNLRILTLLYQFQSQVGIGEKQVLCKPIVVFIASICEAVLADLHMRIRLYTLEGVKNVALDVMDHIRSKKIDEFGKYIASARKHDFFDAGDTSFYEALDRLRKLRNRIHIQNDKRHFEPDEHNAFTLSRQELAERVLEKVMKTMLAKYSRDRERYACVADFQLPWDEHFTETQ